MKEKMEMTQESRLLILLFQVQHQVFEAIESELWQHGISTQQVLALFVMRSLGGSATTVELTRWLLRRPNSISAMLTRMEKNGLVAMEGNPGRKGAMKATVTDKGSQVFDTVWGRLSDYSERVTSSLTSENKESLGSYLESLRDKAFQEASSRMVSFP